MELAPVGSSTTILRTQLGLLDASGQGVYRQGIDFDGSGQLEGAELIDDDGHGVSDGTITDAEAWSFFARNSFRLQPNQVEAPVRALISELLSPQPDIRTAAVVRLRAFQGQGRALRPYLSDLESSLSSSRIEVARAAADVLLVVVNFNDTSTLQNMANIYLSRRDVQSLGLVVQLGGASLITRPVRLFLTSTIISQGLIFEPPVNNVLRYLIESDSSLARRLITSLLTRVAGRLNEPNNGGRRSWLTMMALRDARDNNSAARSSLFCALRNSSQGVRVLAAYLLTEGRNLNQNEISQVHDVLAQDGAQAILDQIRQIRR